MSEPTTEAGCIEIDDTPGWCAVHHAWFHPLPPKTHEARASQPLTEAALNDLFAAYEKAYDEGSDRWRQEWRRRIVLAIEARATQPKEHCPGCGGWESYGTFDLAGDCPGTEARASQPLTPERQEVRFIPQACPACGAFIRVAQPLPSAP